MEGTALQDVNRQVRTEERKQQCGRPKKLKVEKKLKTQ